MPEDVGWRGGGHYQAQDSGLPCERDDALCSKKGAWRAVRSRGGLVLYIDIGIEFNMISMNKRLLS